MRHELLGYLADHHFTGNVRGHREGEVFMPDTPVMVVETTFAAGQLMETLILSVLNFDSAVAAAAARNHEVASGRALIEMGSRRGHEQAAVDAARATWLAGFDATSNLEAGRRWGVPTLGTSAHSFTLAHAAEEAAFGAQVAALGAGTTLLVDTYDSIGGVHKAIEVGRWLRDCGQDLIGIRLDSGDLAYLSIEAHFGGTLFLGRHQEHKMLEGEDWFAVSIPLSAHLPHLSITRLEPQRAQHRT